MEIAELNTEKAKKITREEVKATLGCVCPVCKHYHKCALAGITPHSDTYYKGCSEFELDTTVECSVPCEECYLYILGICPGLE